MEQLLRKLKRQASFLNRLPKTTAGTKQPWTTLFFLVFLCLCACKPTNDIDCACCSLEALTVVSTIPADSSSDISIDTIVAATFSASMYVYSITTNTVDTACTGNIQLSADDFVSCVTMIAAPAVTNSYQTLTVTPASSLQYGTTYKIKVTTAAADTCGNTLETDYNMDSGFTTVSQP